MKLSTNAYRGTVVLLWALALWHSWACRGLFVDGSGFLIQIVQREWFFDFYPPRLYAMIVAQVPMMIGIHSGIDNLHYLSMLLSLGLFALPTGLYHLALWRAKDDPVVLAAVMAAIGVVFLTTSFFIIGEYNSSYAIAILTVVQLTRADRLRTGDALLILPVAVLAIRTYEALIYLGPLVAVLILWTLWRHKFQPRLPALVWLVCAGCFLGGMAVAVDSVVHPWSESHLDETYVTAKNFWQNLQFDLALSGVLVVVIWALVRPADLAGNKPYRWAAIAVGLLAASPLLAFGDNLVRPLAKSQYVARSAGGLVIVAIVIFIWLYRSDVHIRLKALVMLRAPQNARRFLIFACLLVAANVPSDVFLTSTWISYLNAMRQVVTTHQGVVAFEDTKLAQRPYILFVENWVLPSQSLSVRSKPGDAIVKPPRDFTDWMPFKANEAPDLGRFYWRD
jgi:hypothetical protein